MKIIKKLGIVLIIIILLMLVVIFGINGYVRVSTKEKIVNGSEIENADAILILGAGVWGSEPSPMLKDRLDTGIDLYKNKISEKIIVSGDHLREDYDEVNVMKNYAIKNGVESSDVFMDHAGLSTYDSIYRAKEIFKAKKIVIVTQKYHLYRAIYIANKLGLEAYGVSATTRSYKGDTAREIREILARDKDAVKCVFKPKSTYLGEEIPVSGNGDITNDK